MEIDKLSRKFVRALEKYKRVEKKLLITQLELQLECPHDYSHFSTTHKNCKICDQSDYYSRSDVAKQLEEAKRSCSCVNGCKNPDCDRI